MNVDLCKEVSKVAQDPQAATKHVVVRILSILSYSGQ